MTPLLKASGWRFHNRLPGVSMDTVCQANRPGPAPRVPGSSESRHIAPKSKMR